MIPLPRLLAIACLACPLPALAQNEAGIIDAVIAQALAEQRVFLTCGALDPQGYGFLVESWGRMTADTLDYLEAIGTPPSLRDAFADAARPEALRLPADTAYGQVVEFCHANPDWMRQLAQLRMTILPTEIEKALAE